jgi:hypothetical protein
MGVGPDGHVDVLGSHPEKAVAHGSSNQVCLDILAPQELLHRVKDIWEQVSAYSHIVC